MKKLVWEELKQDQAGYMYRCKVPGGWLVKEVHDVCSSGTSGPLIRWIRVAKCVVLRTRSNVSVARRVDHGRAFTVVHVQSNVI